MRVLATSETYPGWTVAVPASAGGAGVTHPIGTPEHEPDHKKAKAASTGQDALDATVATACVADGVQGVTARNDDVSMKDGHVAASVPETSA